MIANLKGNKINKRLDHLTIAKAVREIKKEYGDDLRAVAKKFDVHPYTLRQFDHLNDLPEQIHPLIADGKIGLDKGYNIWRLKRRQSEKTVFARLIVERHLSSGDVRALTQYANRNSELTIEQCVERFIEKKPKRGRLHVVIVGLEDNPYSELKERAKKLGKTIDQLISAILAKELERRN